MPNITEYLTQVQKLTNKNLEILSALNDAFYTDKHHLTVQIDGEKYTIPSFITLENKLNTLTANFENLVDAPATGDAYMTFDGNTQKMQMMGYSQTPHKTDLSPISQFNVESNDIFKDFITPNAFVRLELPTIDNCTKTVNVKKVSLKTDLAKQRFNTGTLTGSNTISYGDVKAALLGLIDGVDYTEYDTMRRLPLRSQTASGDYEIQNVVSKSFNDNYVELYTLQLDTLKYTVDSGTIERTIQVGDELVTHTDNAKLRVIAVREAIREIDIEVENGAYANLGDTSTGIADMYALHYFRSIDFGAEKYVDIPLEEDQYVIIFVSSINDTTNIVAPYGNGLIINTSSLTTNYNNTIYNFNDFYSLFVNNLGDTLYGLTSMMDTAINNLTEAQFNLLKSNIPLISSGDLIVTQINKHLNDSESVKNIRRLYAQKSTYKSELETVQNNIDNINNQLSALDFNDTTNVSELYTSTLADYNEQKTNLVNSINSISQEIAQNANVSDTPIENAKYHIRGFVNITVPDIPNTVVVKLDVEYRYKNRNNFTGNAETIGENKIFSDWNKMTSISNVKVASYENNTYKFNYEDINGSTTDSKNLISWNQIDIPITQGESVDIRVRYIYNYCYPFAECRSEWSAITNVEFPEEFLNNVEILDIIEENNSDIKKQQFTGILTREGVLNHVADKVNDQDNLYFHKSSNIASGFYTEERRVIPLFDKLKSIDGLVEALRSEVMGVSSDNLQITVYDDEYSQVLNPWTKNIFKLPGYTSIPASEKVNLTSTLGLSDVAYKQITIDIYNAGAYDMKLFTSFPGTVSAPLIPGRLGCNGISSDNYVNNWNTQVHEGVFWQTGGSSASIQKYNQWIYFRTTSVYDSSDKYYVANPSLYRTTDAKIAFGKGQCPVVNNANSSYTTSPSLTKYQFITACPIVDDISSLGNGSTLPLKTIQMSCQCNPNEKYITVPAGEHKQVLLGVWYCFDSQTVDNSSPMSCSTTLSFDLRTSLYADPTNYEFTIEADRNETMAVKEKRLQAQIVATKAAPKYKAAIINTSNLTNKQSYNR